MKKRTLFYIFVDILVVFLAFLLAAYFKTGKEKALFNYYWMPFVIFEIIWISSSIIFGKFSRNKEKGKINYVYSIVKSNLFILLIITFVIFFASLSYSRLLIATTVIIATIIETLLGYLVVYRKVLDREMDDLERYRVIPKRRDKFDPTKPIKNYSDGENIDQIRELILNETSHSSLDFIEFHSSLGDPKLMLLSTTTKFNISNQPHEKYNYIVNLKKINDILRINKFFEAANSKLSDGGIYINFVETYSLRKIRILKKYPSGINWIIYTIDFGFKRIIPKLGLTKMLYFKITQGRNRVMSKAETLGRLYSCGFEVVEEKMIDGSLYFVARKIAEPVFDSNPTYGPLIKLRRHGKKGKIIGVYKMRTMHPYSEYLQPYIYEHHKLQDGGKFADDFRINTAGKFMRKFWIDELPMFINVFIGDMKIVGVRPLSSHYFNLYSDELKERRLKHKPGLVPPFYVDLPKTLDEIMASEIKYLDAYEKNPFKTDFVYFWKAFNNIVFKRARSN